MKLLAVLLLVGCACALSVKKDDVIQDGSWMLWKMTHKKSYESFGAEHVRYAVWKDNMAYISEFNARGTESYTLGMNEFGDLTNTEFKRMYNGMKMKEGEKREGALFMTPMNVKIPDEVDWRDKGYVTPVKNQGQCGSCWAFSTTGSLEGQMFKKTGKLPNLSEQQLVDCVSKFGNQGCNGGLMDQAFKYIKANEGIDTEKSYPYEGRNGKCRFNNATIGGEVHGYTDVKSGSEDDLTNAIATVGPISVAIDASHMSFQFYRSGVYKPWFCGNKMSSLDHGVLAVGYGKYSGKTPYYWVKNSWGATWGIKGFIRMVRNDNNKCGIATAASYPLV
jgi:cathepsin L